MSRPEPSSRTAPAAGLGVWPGPRGRLAASAVALGVWLVILLLVALRVL